MRGSLLYSTKQESSWRGCWVLVGFGPDQCCPQRPSCRSLARELIPRAS